MKWTIAAFAGCLTTLPFPNATALPRSPEDRPNFVVLFMDDLGYGDLGFTGHPTTNTPNIDKLAWNGKILTTWYSGCSICTGSRAALMTGRQYPRTGIPGVIGPTTNIGLPLNETTVAEQLKAAGYATGVVGKWHLGQREVYLPGNQGFDYYLGIPYSDDMGDGLASACTNQSKEFVRRRRNVPPSSADSSGSSWHKEEYAESGFLHESASVGNWSGDDPASRYLPLVYQEFNETRIVEQPLDFTHLAEKYNDFAVNFIERHKDQPFFLYVPFSHVHCASASQPEYQYAGCQWTNSTARGAFGDALAESDWIAGNIIRTLEELKIDENTLVLFASDNGPWLSRGLSGGSAGLLTGRYAGYWNTGKGSTWEGGIRSPAFAYWKGKIQPFSRSSEIISSLDVFPTLSALAGVSLPDDRAIDGRDMTDILLDNDGTSKHDFLFFYGTCYNASAMFHDIVAVRHGKYKAHWCTGPGLAGDQQRQSRIYHDYPLLFDVEKDPSEAEPIGTGDMPSDPEHGDAMERIVKAYAFEKATFAFGNLIPAPDTPGEGPGRYGLCCDRAKRCNCADIDEDTTPIGILNIGTKRHHDKYHAVLGEEEPFPPTQAQVLLNRQ